MLVGVTPLLQLTFLPTLVASIRVGTVAVISGVAAMIARKDKFPLYGGEC